MSAPAVTALTLQTRPLAEQYGTSKETAHV
jgi:hypothetical protein